MTSSVYLAFFLGFLGLVLLVLSWLHSERSSRSTQSRFQNLLENGSRQGGPRESRLLAAMERVGGQSVNSALDYQIG
ncbi:MAG: hypothetical protein ACRESZ_12325 [Methylococcales bacterium]